MSSRKLDICLSILLSNTFDKIGSILLAYSFLLSFCYTFYAMVLRQHVSSMMENVLANEKLLTRSQMNFENISEFSLIILVGISEY